MNHKIRNAALVGALAAVSIATAWATSASPARPVALHDSLAPNETVVSDTPAAVASDASAAPVEDRSIVADRASVPQPSLNIEQRRLSRDQRIQADVMDKLAMNRNLSGKIGVESHDAVVTLTGYTSTAGQAWRAGRDARSVVGVRYVDNQVRARVGGSV